MALFRRFFTPPQESFFLFGPRGTGKSIWVKKNYPQGYVIDLLKPETLVTFNTRPQTLRELVKASPKRTCIVIDEVQRVPALLDVVHELIEDQKHSIQFILTGSSSRKLKRAGVNLLGGRALLKNLHPFLPIELKKDFSLEKSLKQGLLPLIWEKKRPLQSLRAYHGLYLKEEVQQEGVVRNVGQFSRFLEAMSFSHGSLLNITNVAQDCSVPRKTVENYVEILKDLLLGFTLPVFQKRSQRDTIKHKKFYYFDTGVYRAIRPKGPLDRPGDIEGAAFEGLLIQCLRAWIDYRNRENELYFWQTTSNQEVDAIVYGEDGLSAIEIKASPQIRPKDLKGLKLFLQDYPEADAYLIYGGNKKLKKDNILCIPCKDFLTKLNPKKNLSEIFQ